MLLGLEKPFSLKQQHSRKTTCTSCTSIFVLSECIQERVFFLQAKVGLLYSKVSYFQVDRESGYIEKPFDVNASLQNLYFTESGIQLPYMCPREHVTLVKSPPWCYCNPELASCPQDLSWLVNWFRFLRDLRSGCSLIPIPNGMDNSLFKQACVQSSICMIPEPYLNDLPFSELDVE
ncbi:hypothetical protein FF38_04931 [Lucilia cuprina]|uniref:Uncharacterized protein n=1 Tax=Lucilia cuprina TaxID=7375 RepID=A0A0L0C080_LUCCU|nr:hypothetical protein FF38_04931 [Lucilia cuprina]